MCEWPAACLRFASFTLGELVTFGTRSALAGLGLVVLAAGAAPTAASAQVQAGGVTMPPADSAAVRVAIDTPVVRRRAHAIEYSDAYNTRLTIHRIGSYTMLPLFASEYYLGDRLLNDEHPASWLQPTHATVAGAIGALFVVNTVTGAWNLWDSRQDPAGRTRRYLHTALMLASDAGFVWTGVSGGQHSSVDAERRHRNIALGSIGVATVGTALMWFWKD